MKKNIIILSTISLLIFINVLFGKGKNRNETGEIDLTWIGEVRSLDKNNKIKRFEYTSMKWWVKSSFVGTDNTETFNFKDNAVATEESNNVVSILAALEDDSGGDSGMYAADFGETGRSGHDYQITFVRGGKIIVDNIDTDFQGADNNLNLIVWYVNHPDSELQKLQYNMRAHKSSSSVSFSEANWDTMLASANSRWEACGVKILKEYCSNNCVRNLYNDAWDSIDNWEEITDLRLADPFYSGFNIYMVESIHYCGGPDGTDIIAGCANQGRYDYPEGIVIDDSYWSGNFSAVMAHEHGHQLNLGHDDASSSNIMYPHVGYASMTDIDTTQCEVALTQLLLYKNQRITIH